MPCELFHRARGFRFSSTVWSRPLKQSCAILQAVSLLRDLEQEKRNYSLNVPAFCFRQVFVHCRNESLRSASNEMPRVIFGAAFDSVANRKLLAALIP